MENFILYLEESQRKLTSFTYWL